MWGISYPGFYVAAGMIDAHPALVAASPQAPVIDLYRGDDTYHNGAFFLAANFGFYTFFEKHAEPTAAEAQVCRSTGERPTATSSTSIIGNLAQADEKYYPRRGSLLDRPRRAPRPTTSSGRAVASTSSSRTCHRR